MEETESQQIPLLKQQLAESQRFLRILFEVTDLADSIVQPQELMARTTDLIREQLGRQVGVIWLLDEAQQQLYFAGASHAEGFSAPSFIEECRGCRFAGGEGLPGRALLGSAVWVPNLARDPNFPRLQSAAEAGLKSGLAIPIKAGSKIVAVLELFSLYTEPVDREALNFFERLSAHIGIAIERKVAHEKLKESQSQLDTKQQNLNAVLDNMAEAVFILNKDGSVALTNAAGIELMGGTPASLPGDFRKLQGLFLPDTVTPFPPEKMPAAVALMDQESTDVEMFVQRESGGSWVSINARPMHDADGQVSGAVVVARDITARRLLQEQLQRAADEAIASGKLKTEFVANVSHEIRTPLAGILGMAELLATRDESDAESRDIAGYVLHSAQSLLEIVNDLLDFSKLEAGKLTLAHEPFNVAEVVEEVARSISISAAKKGLQVSTTVDERLPESLVGDRGRVVQVLLNFAHNAVKFTESGQIKIDGQIIATSSETVRVRLSVRDTGIGIKAAVQRALFEPFVQGDGSTTRRYGGTGLGLSIAKKLTNLMGGEIGFESELGSGSEFWVVLPLARAVPPPVV